MEILISSTTSRSINQTHRQERGPEELWSSEDDYPKLISYSIPPISFPWKIAFNGESSTAEEDTDLCTSSGLVTVIYWIQFNRGMEKRMFRKWNQEWDNHKLTLIVVMSPRGIFGGKKLYYLVSKERSPMEGWVVLLRG